MGMVEEVEELKRRRESTLDAARLNTVQKQKALGKMTARQRVDLLCDAGSFLEFGQLARAKGVRDKESPADGVIVGVGLVRGRRVAVISYDITVMGGSQGQISHCKTDHIHKIALEQGIPIVSFLEGGGARAQDLDSYPYHFVDMWYDQVRMSGWVPMAAGIMGPCFAGHANLAGLCDFVTMVKETASMGVAGPHLIKHALSTEISPLALGSAGMHAEVSGIADMLAEDDQTCISQIKKFLSFFPDNAGKTTPAIPCDDPVEREEEDLLHMVPLSQKKAYDMYGVIRSVVDHDSLFDIKPYWAKNIITCLARLNGRAVGIVANQPMFMAGAIDTPASEKMSHFVELCDAFNIPLVLLADVPGFMAGPDHEKSGIVRRSMKTLYALGHCTVPVVSVILRKSFGMGGYVMGSRGFHPSMLLAWPSAEMGGMGLEGAVEILYRHRIADAENPDELRAELLEELRTKTRAFPTAQVYGVDAVIDPRQTRQALIRALEMLPRRDPCLPQKKHGVAPV